MKFAIALCLTFVATAQDTGSWIQLGSGSIENVRDNNHPALALHYDFGKPQAAAILPAPGALSKMRFRIKSDHDCAIGVVLSVVSSDHPGGGMNALFWAPANRWQNVELDLRDFSHPDGTPAPSAFKANALAISDASFLFATISPNPALPVIIDSLPARTRY